MNIRCQSGEVDSIVTRNGNIIIEGKDIKALNKEGIATNCIFLQKNDKTMVDVSNEISINEQDRIVLRVPSNIEKGKYRLLIHSYFLTQKSEKPYYFRCIEFDKVLNVR